MKTVEELLNKQDLLAWAKTKPPTGVYNYFNEPRCIITNYFYENGHPEVTAGNGCIFTGSFWEPDEEWSLPTGWNQAARGDDISEEFGRGPRTYGAFIERLERLAQ